MRVFKRSGFAHTLKYVNPKIPVQGHEPPGFKRFVDPLFKATNEKYEDLLKLWREFEKEIPKDDKFSQRQLKELEGEAQIFLKKLIPFFDFFYIKPTLSKAKFKEASNFLQRIFSLLKEGDLISDSKVFTLSMLEIISPLEKQQQKARYAYTNGQITGTTERNNALCEEIERQCDGKRKMFVIEGALHLLKHKVGKKIDNVANVQSTLKQRKFAIIIPTSLMKKFGIDKLNSDLQRIPHPQILGG